MAEEEKKPKVEAGAPKWMTTFADLMSLLMCFFVLLLSFSEMDRKKFKIVAGSMEKAFGIQKVLPVMDSPSGQQMISRDFNSIPFDIQTRIMELVSDEISSGMVDVEPEPEGVTLRIRDSVAFVSGKADITQQFKPLLDKIGRMLLDMDASVTVSGHTDNVPLRQGAEFRSNWILSAARAVEVVEYWEGKFNIPPSRLAAAGYAAGQPVAENTSAAGKARNRRVEFKIRPGKSNPAFDGITIDAR